MEVVRDSVAGVFGQSEAKMKERIRKQTREIEKEIRQLKREMANIEREQKKIEKECKKYAEKGDMEMVKATAKQIVRIRNQVQTMNKMKSNLDGVKYELMSARVAATIDKTMGKVSKILQRTRVKPEKLVKRLQKFTREMEKSALTAELVEDALDGVFDTEEAQDELVDEILIELQIKQTGDLENAPRNALKQQEQEEEKAPMKKLVAEGGDDDDTEMRYLQNRMNALTKDDDEES